MTGFRVEEEYLRSFAKVMDSLSADADKAKTYAEDNFNIGYGDARLFFTVAQACSEARLKLAQNYETLVKLADAGAEELRGVATFYEQQDDAEEQRYDASLGEVDAIGAGE